MGGLGEVSPLPGLSIESVVDVEQQLEWIQKELAIGMEIDWAGLLSSVRFGMECALADLQNGGKGLLFESSFTRNESQLTINGLVWMNTYETMLKEALQKVEAGFRCIKFKIGQMDWNLERRLIETLRERFSVEELEIRVDANGAYTFETAMPILLDLARLQVHSIEQPLPVSDLANMKKLIKLSPVPITLDEQLIEVQNVEDEIEFLKDVKPHYLVLKPTLVGGLLKTRRWIAAAESQGIGWWVTSSLETPIALNALAQFTAAYENLLPQGLSTGKIYREDFNVPIVTEGQFMHFEDTYQTSSAALFDTLCRQ